MLSPPALNQISAQLLPRLLAVVPLLLGNINHQHVLRFRTYSSTSIQSRYQIVYLYSQMLRLLLAIAIREWIENVSKYVGRDIRLRKNSKKIFRVPLKQNRRLLSTISVQKSIENERKILLIIYLQQEKFPKIIPSH